MDEILSNTIIWWFVTFDMPIFTGIFLMISRIRRHFDTRQEALREALAEYKLEVAKSYASINQLKDLESRVIAHLLRIETKLDHTALEAHALHHFHPKHRNRDGENS